MSSSGDTAPPKIIRQHPNKSSFPLWEVKSVGEGLLWLRLYIAAAFMLIIMGGLFLVRELVFNVDLNVYDSDWRDQLYDYRVTQPGIAAHHSHFVTATYPVFANGTLVAAIAASRRLPVLLVVQNTSVGCSYCGVLDAELRAAAGLFPEDPTVAGRVLVYKTTAAEYSLARGDVPFANPPFVEVWSKSILRHTYLVNDAASARAVSELARNVTRDYPPAAGYVPPYPWRGLGGELLAASVGAGVPSGTPAKQRVNLSLRGETGGARRSFGWWKDFWPWGGKCANTGYERFWLEGSMSVQLGSLDFGGAGGTRVAVYDLLGGSRGVPTYQVEADLDGGDVTVREITAVNAVVGLAALRGDRHAWKFESIEGEYGAPWTGTLAAAASRYNGGSSRIAIRVVDLGQPEPPRLPLYQGQVYVYVATFLGCGGVMMLLVMPYLLVKVFIYARINNNLPPPFWRSRPEFRGW
mmetsp:Transcript_389/g.1019  ORF Transcript_389/g.1019 Transcript_389/m.1019 type:complete len:466 (-) Transcript_389:45-1442(-)